MCTLSGPQEGMDSFHLQQQLEAKSELLLVSSCVVVGGWDCVCCSRRFKHLVNQQTHQSGGIHCLRQTQSAEGGVVVLHRGSK